MYYISDRIKYTENFVSRFNSKVGDNIKYTVGIRISGIDPSSKSEYPYSIIYYGSVTVLGGTQNIYLNDIIAPHLYDHSNISPSDITYTPNVNYNLSKPVIMVDVQISFPNHNITSEYKNVLQYYQDPTSQRGEEIDLYSTTPKLYNFLDQRTNVVPRVPRLETLADEFWFGVNGGATKGYWSSNTKYRLVGKLASQTTNYKQYTSTYPVWVKNVSGVSYQELIGTDLTIDDGMASYKANEIWLADQSGSLVSKVANIDECPADYYLIWMDRTGAYQCQPFTKKVSRTENITSTTVINMLDESRPAITSIKNTWTLNSDWLNKDEYNAFESIFVSPYLYLYDTKIDKGYWVNCDTKQWTSKTKFDKKLFNLSLSVSSISNQNITY